MVVIDCAYSDSYPFYMNYLYDKTGRYSDWIQNHNKREVSQTGLSAEGEVIFKDSIFHSTERMRENLGVIRLEDNRTFIEISNQEEVEYIAIMSDGVHSFYETISTDTSRSNKSLDYIDVIKKLISFKNFNNAFVQRRMNKFRKDCLKDGWGNADDLSLAVIYLGEK